MFVRVLATGYLHVPELFLRVGADSLEPGYAVYDIDGQSEAVYLIFDGQFERSVDVASLLIAAHVQVLVVCPAIGKPVNQPGIAVEIKDDRFVCGEQAVEVSITQAVRVLPVRLQLEEINDVDEANPQVVELFAQDRRGGQRLLRRNITGASHHYVRLLSLIITGLAPDADALRAVGDGSVHIHVLKVELLIADDHIDVVLATQTMVDYRQ